METSWKVPRRLVTFEVFHWSRPTRLVRDLQLAKSPKKFVAFWVSQFERSSDVKLLHALKTPVMRVVEDVTRSS